MTCQCSAQVSHEAHQHFVCVTSRTAGNFWLSWGDFAPGWWLASPRLRHPYNQCIIVCSSPLEEALVKRRQFALSTTSQHVSALHVGWPFALRLPTLSTLEANIENSRRIFWYGRPIDSVSLPAFALCLFPHPPSMQCLNSYAEHLPLRREGPAFH